MMYILFLIISCCYPPLEHDFHVSRLTLDYKKDEHQFEVMLHVFTDDLELALQERGAPPARLNTPGEWEKAEESIQSYLADVLQLKLPSGELLSLEYLGKESSDDFMATWIYFYWKLPKAEHEFTINHRLLHEIYDDQQNILKVVGCDPEGLKLLTSEHTKVNIKCSK